MESKVVPVFWIESNTPKEMAERIEAAGAEEPEACGVTGSRADARL